MNILTKYTSTRHHIFQFFIFSLVGIIYCSCKKYLDTKPDQKLAIPYTLNDVEALLNDNYTINSSTNASLGEGAADNYYLLPTDYNALSQGDRNIYVWGEELFYNTFPNSWSGAYKTIYYANLILETASKHNSVDSSDNWDEYKAEALFLRGWTNFVLVTDFANVYDSISSDLDLGIVLRMSTNFNEKLGRSTLKQSYEQILQDILTAYPKLLTNPIHVLRPSKGAAFGLLSRIYLSMRNYEKAEVFADSALKLNSSLMDYNSFSSSARYPFTKFNVEDIFHSIGLVEPANNLWARIDSSLYNSYNQNDLRKVLYFGAIGDGTYKYKGSYDRSLSLFNGIATDELYLTKAECLARKGNSIDALNYLNQLLKTRYITNTYINYAISNTSDVLTLILTERRKELVMRDIRWMDIKRLNKEGANIQLKRNIAGVNYLLEPNSPRYALPIPAYVIGISGITQNPK